MIVDPAALHFLRELNLLGIPTAGGLNNVSYGIATQASLLSEDHLVVSDRCPGFIAEAPGYSWDAKAALLGKDEPIKVNDHSLDGGRYVIATTENMWRPVLDWPAEVVVVAASRFPKPGGSVEVIGTQTFESARFQNRYGRLTSMLRRTIGQTTYPELSALLSLQTGSAPPCEITLDTTRGRVTFVAEGFTNGRLNFIVLHVKSKLSGPKLKLVSTDGFELLPS
ncbi:hypothetical protein [Microbacterium sp. BH-3-3-3]|uniref:hypothetical protein n=1 Tax=Microbacterium sp. BH-3-3-3 TaxID=1906742 RepID=UPI0011A067B1|nr:hypothetical protein [Microbacterium sp. BH-3-3-3]